MVSEEIFRVSEPRPVSYQYETVDLNCLRESYDTEFKKALGRDGKGQIPDDFWESYSAMANTEGGYIFLGIEEKKDALLVHSLDNVSKMMKELWDTLNNPTKVSMNILQRADITDITYEGKTLIQVRVPQATRTQRPVYVGTNPLRGTFFRRHEGDYVCTPDHVKIMLGEQVNDTRDAVLLERFSYEDDIDKESLRAYRQIFLNRKPDHPFHSCDDITFLRHIGGIARDRVSGREDLTLAGLLMFGQFRSIFDAVPNYHIDYQEHGDADVRWTDRVTTDGTWSGNIFDFYRSVIRKLTADLKIPFRLKGDMRVEDTPVHEALREALVNTLIHADYSGNGSILIVKRPDQFGFKNPGLMRVSREEAIKGGVSDCRNRNMQKMFQLIGLGEQAGSGFLKIYRNWTGEHWRQPELWEEFEKNQTVFVLKMISLYPEPVIEEVREKLGEAFDQMSSLQRIALIIAKSEGCVTHRRLKDVVKDHPHDISQTLVGLVRSGFLEQEGHGRMSFYYFPGEHPMQGELFGVQGSSDLGSPEHERENLDHLHDKPVHLAGSLDHLEGNLDHVGQCLDHSGEMGDHFEQVLMDLAEPIRVSSKSPGDQIEDTILKLCSGRYVTIDQLAYLLGRGKTGLRTRFINRMVHEGRLVPKYRNIPSHPKQGYTAATGGEE